MISLNTPHKETNVEKVIAMQRYNILPFDFDLNNSGVEFK